MAFDRKKTLWESGYVSDSLYGVRANNITPMTVTGTNTFIIHTPGTPKAMVVDPGPTDVEHLQRVMAAVQERGAEVGAIFITHTHADHICGTDLLLHMIENGAESVQADAVPESLDGSRFWPKRFGRREKASFENPVVPVYASDLGNCPTGTFEPYDGCPSMEIVPLPGHSDDTVGLVMHDYKHMLTGDNIFRFWSSAVPYGDGNIRDYLASLDVMQHLVRDGVVEQLVPAHGFPIDQPIKTLEGYRAHRLERLQQVRNAIDSGAGFDPEAIVKVVYGDITDPLMIRAAFSTTYAQLEYLADEYQSSFQPNLELLAFK